MNAKALDEFYDSAPTVQESQLMLKLSREYFMEYPNEEDRPEELDDLYEDIVDRMKKCCEGWEAGRKRHHNPKRARFLAFI